MQSTRPQASPQARLARVLAIGATTLILAGGPASADYGYSYFRTVEGYATLDSAEDGSSLEVLENHPLVAGDLLQVGSNSRVEVVLPDGSLLRIAERSDIRFDSLAWTPDTADRVTRLYLRKGEIQLVLDPRLEREEPLELETRNATFYLEAPGEYRLTSDGYDRTELVVREGFAEAQTDRGSAIVRSDEVAYIEGDEWASVEIASAGRRDRLEYWGDELDEEAQLADTTYVEEDLRYRAARMANHGSWIEIGGRYGWRPQVRVGWRPYVAGTWVHTPSGLTWVSSEPWGWIPSHYGSWDLVPGYGWLWFAGSFYSPASVYWYWGPTHVAWVPSGYYTSFYSPSHHRVGPRFGIYGWAGGDWGFFAEWVFCPTRYFGRTHYDRYFRSGHEVARHATYREIPRGVIATDTRSVGRDVWGQPERIMARLAAADTRLAKTRDLPDVTDFVARRRDLGPEVAAIVKPRDLGTGLHRGRPVALKQNAARVRSRLESGRTGSVSSRFEEHKDNLGRRTPVARRQAEGTSRRSVVEPGAESKARTFERRGYGQPEIQRRSSGAGRVERPSSRERWTIRDFVARERFAMPSRDKKRPVVQEVIERMRSRQAPAASSLTRSSRRSTPSSSSKATPPSRPPRRDSNARSGRSRASGSSDRSSSSAKARSSSGRSPRQQSTSRSRSAARRKPPGDN